MCNRIYWYTFLRGHTRAYAFTLCVNGSSFSGLQTILITLWMYRRNYDPSQWVCNTRIAVHYQLLNHSILANIFLSIEFLASLLAGITEEDDQFTKHKQDHRYNHTVRWLNDINSKCHYWHWHNIPSYDCWQWQEYKTCQHDSNAWGSPGVCGWCLSGKCVKLYSTIVGFNL